MGGWAVVALVFAGYAVVARQLDRIWVTAPLVLVVAGTILGASYLDVLPVNPDTESIKLVTELTLALILFADASTVNLRQAERDVGLPGRLLGIGLPLTIALGTVTARLVFPSVTWPEAALISAILAPTDAALGLAVVTNEAVPVRIRRLLNIESGLNDGIATPFVTVFLAMVVLGVVQDRWATEAFEELARGAGIGIAVGLIGGVVARWANGHRWSTPMSDQLLVLSLAFGGYETAIHFTGNGFVAAFIAGLVFGGASHGQLHEATEFTDTVGLFSSFLVWIIFGAAFVGPVLRDGIHWRPILYAALSLTVVRLLPVGLALIGTGFRRDSVCFIGWFGPRGLASVVFTLLAFDELHGSSLGRSLVEVTTWAILLSVVAHGISSHPLAARYGKRLQSAVGDIPELESVPTPRLRSRGLS